MTSLTTTKGPGLLDPLKVGSLRLPNRVIMAPLTRCRAGEGRVATVLMAEYYRQRASAGLIISEATAVTPMGWDTQIRPGFGQTSRSKDGNSSRKRFIRKAEEVLARGEADAVAFGRPFIANPDRPRRFALGAQLNVPDPKTFYAALRDFGYTDYPTLRTIGG